jgi:beta-glucanase (GH16 family)
MKLKILIISLLTGFIQVLSCMAGPPDSINWDMIWHDEFNADTLDPEKWTIGQEWDQDNCDYPELHNFNGRELYEVSNGTLKQKSWKEQSGNKPYIGCVLKTRRSGNNPPLFTLQYGYVEVRMRRTVVGEGFHMNAYTFSYDSTTLASSTNGGHVWPSEIDFAETLSRDYYRDKILNALHNTGPDEEYWNEAIDWSEWHTYAFDWHKNGHVDFYIDGNLVHSSTVQLIPDYPQYLLLRIGVGGWIGEPDENTEYPGIQEVDWVRVYQKKEVVNVELKDIENGDVFLGNEPIEVHTITSSEEGNIGRVDFYANDSVIGTDEVGPDYGFIWENPEIGRYRIKAVAFSTEGGFSESELKYITVGDTTGNLLFNSEFDFGINNWQFEVSENADANSNIDNNGVLSGTNSFFIHIDDPGSSTSDITLNQNVYLEENKEYKLSFVAKSNEARNIIVKLHSEEPGNFTNYILKLADLTSQYQAYNYFFKSDKPDYFGKLTFSVGSNPSGVYIDSVVLYLGVENPADLTVDRVNQLQLYPNPAIDYVNIVLPFNSSKEYELRIYDLSGVIIFQDHAWINRKEIPVHISNIPPGCYLIGLSAGDKIYRKMLVISGT